MRKIIDDSFGNLAAKIVADNLSKSTGLSVHELYTVIVNSKGNNVFGSHEHQSAVSDYVKSKLSENNG